MAITEQRLRAAAPFAHTMPCVVVHPMLYWGIAVLRRAMPSICHGRTQGGGTYLSSPGNLSVLNFASWEVQLSQDNKNTFCGRYLKVFRKHATNLTRPGLTVVPILVDILLLFLPGSSNATRILP